MYAIIKISGKQYRVAKGDIIDVDLQDAQDGAKVEFNDVLFFNNGSASKIGLPLVSGCLVIGEILEEVAGPKITSVKYKRSHNQWRKFGHRQRYTRVKILEIQSKEKEGKESGKGRH